MMNKKYQNNQLWCECQLVALWNACKFLGKEPPILGSSDYCFVCIDSGGVYGGCINIEKEKDLV